jgi:HAE1 family hydrophobic/amphiphilic exporter-1
MGASQSTAYKSEIDVKMIDQKTEQMILTSMPPNETAIRKILVGAKVKTVPVGILGTAEDAPIALIVTGTSLESAMVLQSC